MNEPTKKQLLSELRKQPERKLLFTKEELAALCGVSPSRIDIEIKDRKLKIFPVGNEVKISRLAVEEWLITYSRYE